MSKIKQQIATKIVLFFTAFIAISTISSCFDSTIERMPKEDLFTLSFGKMEDQLDLFQTGSINRKNSFSMKDGFFYIANGNSSKLLQFTSYGDLLLLLYNSDPDINPVPVVLKSENGEEHGEKITNRLAVGFPFQDIGEIAADNDANIYVEDSLPREQQIEDAHYGVLLRSRVLRFNRQGKLIDLLGQEGVGGTPFPYISKIYITKQNEPVIICMVPQEYLVYWYSKQGTLLYSLKFNTNNFPKEKDYITTLDKICPDLSRAVLYFQLSYYTEEIDQSTKTKSTIKDTMTRIYIYDVKNATYSGFIKVPAGPKIKVQNGSNEIEIPGPSYELLGVNENDFFFFIRPESTNDMRLLLLDSSGKEYKTKILSVDDSEKSTLYYKYTHMSESGIISSLFCYKDYAKVIQWRTDSLIGVVKNEK
jgi:hypothetical protein